MTGVRGTGRQLVRLQLTLNISAHCHHHPDLQLSIHWALISLWPQQEDIPSLLPHPGSGAIPPVRLGSREERASGCL